MYKYILVLFLSISLLQAADKESINQMPFDYMNVQYAGNLGFVSLGGGNTFYDGHYDFELYLGWTPKAVSEVAIFTFALKNNYVPYTYEEAGYEIRPYIGLGFFFALNQRYDPNWQDDIEKNYYYQNFYHFSGHLGLNINVKKEVDDSMFEKVGLYVETTTVDTYLISYFSNSEVLTLDDIFTIAFGIRVTF